MANTESSSLLPNFSANYSYDFANGTEPNTPMYVFTPAGSTAKLVLFILMVAFGGTGALGNCLVLSFIKRKQAKPLVKSSRFVANFNLYITSLALSDILSGVVSVPLFCIQLYFDVFQEDWACRIARYIHVVFPVITINNLLVISVEKYLSTRKVPRTFRVSAVRKMIALTWGLGFLAVLPFIATFTGIEYQLDDTHFTVVCIYSGHISVYRWITILFVVLQYILPTILLSVINVALIKTVWVRSKMIVDILRTNQIKAKIKAAKMRATTTLIAVTFAFLIPYASYFLFIRYNMLFHPSYNFQKEYVIRYSSGVLAFSNGVINVVIYIVQMKDFRAYLKGRLTCKRGVVGNLRTTRQRMSLACNVTELELRTVWEGSYKPRTESLTSMFSIESDRQIEQCAVRGNDISSEDISVNFDRNFPFKFENNASIAADTSL